MKSILLSDCKKLWKFQGKRRRASLVGSFSLFAGMTASRSNYLFLRWSWRAELYLLLIWGRAIIEKSFSLDNVSENCLNSRGRCHKAITNTVSIFTRSGWNVSVNTNTVYNAIQRFHLGIFSFVVLSTRSVVRRGCNRSIPRAQKVLLFQTFWQRGCGSTYDGSHSHKVMSAINSSFTENEFTFINSYTLWSTVVVYVVINITKHMQSPRSPNTAL